VLNSLKVSTHSGGAAVDDVDLHEGQESTLVLMNHMFENRVVVTRRYGSVPRIRCWPAEINQVFLHLLTRAVEAMPGDGVITIGTSSDADQVQVEIADTGTGMTEQEVNHLFDPIDSQRGAAADGGVSAGSAGRVAGGGGPCPEEGSGGAAPVDR